MATIWQRTVDDTTYEVRNAGRTLRLYTNGILHTQFNPQQVVTGSVWDLLLLGAFLVPENRLKRVLVLGVGGGAVLHQIGNFFPNSEIYGIELNPIHVQVAKKFFGLGSQTCHLVEDDAIQWIKEYQGPKFDLIIEDLFHEIDGEPDRVIEADREWIETLCSHLSDHGSLVINFIENDSFRYASRICQSFDFASGFRISTGNCFNIVGTYCRNPITSKGLLERLREYPSLDTRKKSCRLSYRIRTIFNV